MPYPYAIAADDINNLVETPTGRVVGPYKHGSNLYLFAFTWPDTGDQAELRAYKSTDEGASWFEQDDTNRPLAYDGQYGGEASEYISTMQDGTDVVVAFLTAGGAVLEDGLAPGQDWPQNQLAFVKFNMALDAWGSTNQSGITVYNPQTFSGGPPHASEGQGFEDFNQGDWYLNNGWGLTAMVKRANGDYVFLYDADSHVFEITQHIPADVSFGNTYRRTFVVVYSGMAWQDPQQAFLPGPFAVRQEYWPGNLVLGDDDEVHLFGLAVEYEEDFGTQPDGDPYQSPQGDQIKAYAHHQVLLSDNSLQTPQTISENLKLFTHPLIEAGRANRKLFVPYHKQTGELVVSEASLDDPTYTWTETEIVDALEIVGPGVDPSQVLDAALVISGSTPYLFWVTKVFEWDLYYSRYISDAWTPLAPTGTVDPVLAAMIPEWTGINVSGRAITGAIGLNWWYSSGPEREWQYWQMAVTGAGGPRNRNYGV